MGPGAGAAADIRERSGADAPDRPRFWERRQAQGMLTGKVVCGCCGGTMAAVGKDISPSARRAGKACAATATASGAAIWRF